MLLVLTGLMAGVVGTAPVGVATADSIGVLASPGVYYYNTVFGVHPVAVGTYNNPEFSPPFGDHETLNVLGLSKLTHNAYGVHFELDRQPVWGQPFTLTTSVDPNDPVHRYVAQGEPGFPTSGFDEPTCLRLATSSDWSSNSGQTPDRFTLTSTSPRYTMAYPNVTQDSLVCPRGLGSRTYTATFDRFVPQLNENRGWQVFSVSTVSACKVNDSGCISTGNRRFALIIVFGSGLAPVAPTASFTATAQPPGATTWIFDGSASSAANGATIARWDWTFSDGTTATGPTPTKSFSRSGSHTATLTITDSNGLTNSTTREFEVVPALIVNSTGDAANADDAGESCDTGELVGDRPECTLRAAIEAANATPGTDQLSITFAIPGGAVPIITLTSPMPEITHPVSLDATTQAAGKVAVRPAGGSVPNGFRVNTPTTSIAGFVMGGFTGTAVHLVDAAEAIVAKNVIGLAIDGSTPDPVRDGVVVERGRGIRIGGDATEGNVISAANNAVVIGATAAPSPATEVVISHNRIGTNAAGTSAIGAGPAIGIFAIGDAATPVELAATSNVIHSGRRGHCGRRSGSRGCRPLAEPHRRRCTNGGRGDYCPTARQFRRNSRRRRPRCGCDGQSSVGLGRR